MARGGRFQDVEDLNQDLAFDSCEHSEVFLSIPKTSRTKQGQPFGLDRHKFTFNSQLGIHANKHGIDKLRIIPDFINFKFMDNWDLLRFDKYTPLARIAKLYANQSRKEWSRESELTKAIFSDERSNIQAKRRVRKMREKKREEAKSRCHVQPQTKKTNRHNTNKRYKRSKRQQFLGSYRKCHSLKTTKDSLLSVLFIQVLTEPELHLVTQKLKPAILK